MIVGTRPEIIKLAPVIAALGNRARVIHTGQHYDRNLAGAFFEELGIGEPDVVLGAGARVGRSAQIGIMMMELATEFERRRPAAVIVQGDTNTVSAGAQAANYAGIPVIHVEAGLRSFDRGMPEEINRLVVAALADVHCAATEDNADALRAEGVRPAAVIVTGNTIVEGTQAALERATAIDIPAGAFALATIHRPENTDSERALRRVLSDLGAVSIPVVLVLHPRTRAAVVRHGLESLLAPLTVLEPVGHPEILALASSAELLISDSGGFQEECTVLKKPLLVVRRSTERPESIAAGFASLITPAMNLAAAVNDALDGRRRRHLESTASPYGDGLASARIAQIAISIADGVSVTDAISGAARIS
ncbi:UDP-N-acetylglucosamine 2-epimerase (non-hydrolysing) [Microterricola gilva]|uniref:UDP-N-acetylglucosamine 2-epimerase (Non-hydrolysing) n=1 Tax=Microterricola gilva TaxID=393267 RepID=A0A4Q8APL0_9MICO|nr:UDP-N-acetylglucosamine 2-epimerase (non-hydrolyzing) [Microterricola gilva]RZU65909.1 UDP-N-acetylglucosamine 2-epimerase (non-hydrolysing) [Microterricola gilva]